MPSMAQSSPASWTIPTDERNPRDIASGDDAPWQLPSADRSTLLDSNHSVAVPLSLGTTAGAHTSSTEKQYEFNGATSVGDQGNDNASPSVAGAPDSPYLPSASEASSTASAPQSPSAKASRDRITLMWLEQHTSPSGPPFLPAAPNDASSHSIDDLSEIVIELPVPTSAIDDDVERCMANGSDRLRPEGCPNSHNG